MSTATIAGKRRIPTSSSMLPDEIEEIQSAARTQRITMSDFIRKAAVREARKVNRRATESAAA
ncbi:MAG: hypothetical protein C0503_02805 [Gemmatimonas sp.]|nr:hypothetical protein [Gemmatimonas sp.]